MSTSTEALPWRKLLVTTDFSAESLIAWRHASAIAGVQPVQITALHVTEPAFEGLRIHTEGLHGELRAQAEDRLRDMVESHLAPSAKVTTRLENGRAASVICEVAKDSAVDLIVISSHGHSGIRHVLLGSVVADVVRHAPCAVLVVPAGSR